MPEIARCLGAIPARGLDSGFDPRCHQPVDRFLQRTRSLLHAALCHSARAEGLQASVGGAEFLLVRSS
jgi:hypothetical protein